MNWFRVADFPGDADLGELHRYFDRQGLVHRITESGSRQELWIANSSLVDDARAFVEAWQQGKLQLPDERLEDRPEEPQAPISDAGQAGGIAAVVQAYPLTLIIIALGVAGYVILSVFAQTAWVSALTFQKFQPTIAGLMFEPVTQALQRGELWRLLTPAFLHFNLLHIVFNGLWIWEFGKRLEVYFSRRIYLTLFIAVAIGANIVQYLAASDALFGGLSGVVYGYLGVLFVAQRIAPSPVLAVPPGIFIFMLLWLALGVFGVIDFFLPGSSAVGNGAHLGGLLFGLIFGYIFLHRKSSPF
jgi:GlpG protein